MEFPVDVLGSVSHEELEQEAEAYLAELRYVTPDKAQSFTLNSHRKIRISLSNVGFVPVYGGDLRHKVLALFAPEDQLTAVALFLAGEWWTVEDILKTSNPPRAGLVKVRTLGEKIVLYVLNRIVYRVGEMAKPEVPFLCHSQHDFAKILWKDGQAIGFYSIKPKDSLSNNFVTQRYQLPVMDTIFIRKSHRGNGHGLQMLEDFVDSFKDDELGLKYPLSVPMYKVCSQYLHRYPADEDLFWVVEGVGGPYQRESVASKLKTLAPKVNLELFTANGDHQPENNHTDIDVEENEASSVNSAEITEDVVVVNKPVKLLEDKKGTTVSTHTRSSERKRPREETEEVLDEGLPSKVNRSEKGEAEASTTTSVEEEIEGDEKEESSASVDEEADTEAAVAPEAPVKKDAAAEPSPQEVEEVSRVMVGEQADEEEEEETKMEAEEEGEVVVEVPQEQESMLENGTGVEDVDMEEKEEVALKEQESTGEKDTVDAAAMEAEEQTAKKEAEEQTAEEEVEEGAGTASGEEPCSATEEASLPSDSAPEELSTTGEMAEEAGEEPPGSLEAAAVPVEEEKEEKAMEANKEKEAEEENQEKEAEEENQEEGADVMDSNHEAVLLIGVADLTYQPPEDTANAQTEEGKEEEEEEEKKELAKDAAVSSEEEEKEVAERSSDEAEEAPAGRRKGRRGRTTKRRSKRLSKAPAEEEDVKITEEEEENVVTTEEEGEAVEKTSAEEEEEEEEEEEPPVVDQRAQRRPVRSPGKSRGKRRSKT